MTPITRTLTALAAATLVAACSSTPAVTIDTSSTAVPSETATADASPSPSATAADHDGQADHAAATVGLTELEAVQYAAEHDLDLYIASRGPEDASGPPDSDRLLTVTLEQYPGDDTWIVATATADVDGHTSEATYDGPTSEDDPEAR